MCMALIQLVKINTLKVSWNISYLITKYTEIIYEGVVSPSYKNTIGEEANHAGHSSKYSGEAATY